MLAGIALIVASVVLIKMGKAKHAWIALLPTAVLLVVTVTAGWQKLFDADVKIGFLAHASKFSAAMADGRILAPARSLAEMQQIVFNDYVDAALAAGFLAVLLLMLVFGVRVARRALSVRWPTARETPAVYRKERQNV
jgi:carbon starvation protein